MAIIRWDPFRDLMNLHEKMDSLFEDAILPRQDLVYSGSWMPMVDIYETDDEIVVNAEIPGIDSEDITVKVSENSLIIKGERKLEKGLREENYHLIERNHGRFQRAFSLPVEVDHENAQAVFRDGVLEIVLPKAPSSKSKTIEVKIT
jgi:HSP20 family protein